MRRRLVNLIAVLSLGSCILATALWIRSYDRQDLIERWRWEYSSAVTRVYRVTSGYGAISFTLRRTGYLNPAMLDRRPVPDRNVHWSVDLGTHDASFRPVTPMQWLGFRWDSDVLTPPTIVRRYYRCSVPYWMIVLLSAIAPAWRYWRRRGRFAPGLCPTCGYDVRATPGRCPECGTATKAGHRA